MTQGAYQRIKAKYEYKNLTCNGCGIKFDSKGRNKNQKYCSYRCRAIYAINKGKFGNRPPWNKGIKGYNNFHRDEKWKDNISKSLNKYWDKKGRKTPANTLIRKQKEFKIWREAVFKRDNYTCQKCGARGKKGRRVILHPHHIKFISKFPELAYVVSNGITFCDKCHQKIHRNIKLTLTGKEAIKL
jgi:5-methylcytosine-specific restriction endonuclease McrA